MAVVTSSFNAAANTVWASSTWNSNDPSYKINTEITNWVNAINDSSKISLLLNPGDATARGSTDYVHWQLQCRENDTSSDFGINFLRRYSGTNGTNSSTHAGYHTRNAGTANNGYGTYTAYGHVTGNQTLTAEINYFTAYEASGSTPWLIVSMENAAKDARNFYALLRLDTSALASGSYYPSTGLGKWVYTSHQNASLTALLTTPQSSNTSPYKGSASSSSINLFYPIPDSSLGDSYFFRLAGQYGANHYLGQPTTDIIVSNANTGVWGDTTTIAGTTYKKVSACFWCKTS